LRELARPRSDSLGSAVDDLTVLDETLDEPVLFTKTAHTRLDAVVAQIVVTIVTDAAVEMRIRHGLVAAIAEHLPDTSSGSTVRLHKTAELLLKRGVFLCKLFKECSTVVRAGCSGHSAARRAEDVATERHGKCGSLVVLVFLDIREALPSRGSRGL